MSRMIKTSDGWKQTSGNVDSSELDAIKQSLAQLEDKIIVEQYGFTLNLTTSFQVTNVAQYITDATEKISQGYKGIPIMLTEFATTVVCEALHPVDYEVSASQFRIVTRGSSAKNNQTIRLVVMWIKQ